MSQNLATNSIRQMPQVTSPNLLHMKIIDQLIANRLDQTTYAFTRLQLLWPKLRWLAVLRGNRKLKFLFFKKLLLQWLRKIGSIGQKQTSIPVSHFLNHVDVMDIGRGKLKRLNHTDRVDLHMEPKTVKGLVAQFFAIASYPLKKFRAPGSDELAHMDRKAVKNDNSILEWFGHILEQLLFDRPELRRLASEAHSATEIWEVIRVESLEEFEDSFVRFKAEDFADKFHCKYFAVSQLGHRSSLSECSLRKTFFHKIISFTEEIYDKISKIHFFALHGQRNISLLLSSIDQRAFFVSVLG